MKHKVSDLDSALLDAAVALALGLGGRARIVAGEVYVSSPIDREKWIADKHRDGMLRLPMPPRESLAPFRPSRDWEHGGPIIEREAIRIKPVFFDDRVEAPPFQVDYWEATDARTGRRRQ